MTTPISYTRLDEHGKRAVARRLVLRRKRYSLALRGLPIVSGAILIVGDRPGPGAPTTEGYHHTPFYSIKHCSGWLNTALHLSDVPEEKLVWINSADHHGIDTDFSIVTTIQPSAVVALGGNAEKWLKKNGCTEYSKFHHPQYWKRFRNGETYDLIEDLRKLTLP